MIRSAGSKLQKFQKDSIKYHSLVLSLIIVVSFFFANPVITLFVGGLLHTILALFIILSEKKNNSIQITPVSIFFLYVFFSYGISPVFIATQLLEQNYLNIINILVYDNSIEKGYLINSVGILFLHLGLQLLRPNKNIHATINNYSLSKLLFLFLIGIVFLLNPVLSFYLGSFFISSIVWLPIAIILYIVLEDRQSLKISLLQKKIIVTILTVVVLVIQVFSLSKLNILLAMLPLIWLFIKENEKKWKTAAIFILLMVFYSYFIYPFVTSARQNFLSTLTTNNIIGELSSSQEVRSYLIEGDYVAETRKLNPKHNAIEAFLIRMFDSVPSGFISDEVERVGFTNGTTLEYVIYGFVPRVFWPDKPIVSRGGWFTRYIGVDYASATAMTSSGELYWNFGFIGVAVGTFIIGLLYAGLWRMVGTYPQHSVLSVLLYFLVMYGMMVHSEAGSTFIAIIQYYLLFGSLFFIHRSFVNKNILSYSTVSR